MSIATELDIVQINAIVEDKHHAIILSPGTDDPRFPRLFAVPRSKTQDPFHTGPPLHPLSTDAGISPKNPRTDTGHVRANTDTRKFWAPVYRGGLPGPLHSEASPPMQPSLVAYPRTIRDPQCSGFSWTFFFFVSRWFAAWRLWLNWRHHGTMDQSLPWQG